MLARRWLWLTVLAPLACGSGETTHGEAAVLALLAAQAEAWNRHDAEAWVTPFAADAVFVNILGMRLTGREQIKQRHAELFRGLFSKSRVVVTTRRVRSLGATSALAETDYELRDYERLPPPIRPTEPDGMLRTRLTYVLTLTQEGWRVVFAQNTAIVPLPPVGR